jgi:hypothetical protein
MIKFKKRTPMSVTAFIKEKKETTNAWIVRSEHNMHTLELIQAGNEKGAWKFSDIMPVDLNAIFDKVNKASRIQSLAEGVRYDSAQLKNRTLFDNENGVQTLAVEGKNEPNEFKRLTQVLAQLVKRGLLLDINNTQAPKNKAKSSPSRS